MKDKDKEYEAMEMTKLVTKGRVNFPFSGTLPVKPNMLSVSSEDMSNFIRMSETHYYRTHYDRVPRPYGPARWSNPFCQV